MVITFLSFFLVIQSVEVEPPPRGIPVLIPQEGDPNPTTIARIDFEVEVLGFLSQTTVTVELEDPDSFNQEAGLLVHLPPHSLVDHFQLNIGEAMVDGVVQEKHLARIGFEREKRKKVDPGLIEWVAQDLYRIRVFPIRKDLPRKVRFRYSTPLGNEGSNDVYKLNLEKLKPHTPFSVSFIQHGQGSPPAIDGDFQSNLEQTSKGWVWFLASDHSFGKNLRFVWLDGQRANLMSAKHSNQWHLALRTKPKFQPGHKLPRPHSVAVFWDASNSRDPETVDQDIEALFSLIACRYPRKLHLIVFRDTPEPPQTFDLKMAERKVLRDTLKQITYDGGTNLRGLSLPHDVDPNEIWLFSDGHDTLGMPVQQHFMQKPVFAFSSSPTSNWPYLNQIARENSGAAMQWQNPDEASLRALFSSEHYRVGDLTSKNGDLLDLHYSESSANQTLYASAKADHEPKQLFLLLGDQQQSIINKQTNPEPSLIEITSHWLKRFSHNLQLERYSLEPDYFRHDILGLAETYGLVTQQTSLIVFETLEQYAENDLQPPENGPFDLSKMPDLSPTKDDLEEMKAGYFHELGSLWKSYYQYNATLGHRDVLNALLEAPYLRKIDLISKSFSAKSFDQQPSEALGQDSSHSQNSNSFNKSEGSFAANNFEPQKPSTNAEMSLIEVELRVVDHKTSGETLHSSTGTASLIAVDDSPTQRDVKLKSWQEVKPAIERIRKSKNGFYNQYLKEKKTYGRSPSFYYQTANLLAEAGHNDLATRVATNLLEQQWQDDLLLLATGMLCNILGELNIAEAIYEKLAKQRPEWPHPRMFLAQIERERGINLEATDKAAAIKAYMTAFQRFSHLVQNPWGSLESLNQFHYLEGNRFHGILITAIEEAFWIQQRLKKLGKMVQFTLPKGIEATANDIKADLRVLLWWSDDYSDLDLHITEPQNIEVNYSNTPHSLGGTIYDCVNGFGPDIYRQKNGRPGDYLLQIVFFNSLFSEIVGPIHAKVELWTRYGYPDETYRVELKRLEKPEKDELLDLATIQWPPH